MRRRRKQTNLARSLRRVVVPAEQLLWKALRNRALGAFKFRRQHPIGSYIVDFACVLCKVIVEADGATHLTSRSRDLQRTAYLEADGWLVLRFWNSEVYDEINAVKEVIYRECVKRLDAATPPHPNPLPPPTAVSPGILFWPAGGEGTA